MPGAPCSLTRDPARGNAVVEIHNCFFNQGEVKTDGIDVTLRTNFDLGGAGRLTNVLQASWQNEFTIDGGTDQVQTQGFPAARATLNNQWQRGDRSEEHTSELQSLMRISYAVFCLKKKKNHTLNI